MLSNNTADFIIVGAGISGLTLGYFLKKAGFCVILLESSSRVGGPIFSIQHQGFLSEMGPRSVCALPAFFKLVDHLKLGNQLLFPRTNSLQRLIGVKRSPRKQSQLFPLPKTIADVLHSPLLTLRAKCRLLLEPVWPLGRNDDEYIRVFLESRFGKEVGELASTILSGIWASDISTQSARSSLPQLWSYQEKYGSLLWGIFNESKKGGALYRNKPQAVSFCSGMSTLTHALGHELSENICFNAKVTQVNLENDGVSVLVSTIAHPRGITSHLELIAKTTTFFAKSVILTTPAFVTGQLISQFAPALGTQVQAIPYAPIGVLSMALPRNALKQWQQTSGFLVAPGQWQALLGATFDSHVFSGRAPEGYDLMTCYSGGVHNPEYSDVSNTEVQNKVITELAQLLELKKNPIVLHQKYLPSAVPYYPVRHYRLQAALRNFSRVFSRIQILGNWIQGIGVGHRIEEAEKLSQMLIRSADEGVGSRRSHVA